MNFFIYRCVDPLVDLLCTKNPICPKAQGLKKRYLRMLFTQSLSCQIRIVINVNVMSKFCSKYKKLLCNELLLTFKIQYVYFFMELGSNNNGLIAKQRKIGLIFSDFVFRLNLWQYYDIKS